MKKKKRSILLLLSSFLLCIVSAAGYQFRYRILAGDKSSGIIHISLDDTINIFRDITENQKVYDSIFDNELLGFLKDCHKKYDACFSLYCFYESPSSDFTLNDCTDKYLEEFQDNSDWLKLGFHAINSESDLNAVTSTQIREDYLKLTNELCRIAGAESIDSCTRLSKFEGNEQAVNELKKSGVQVLFTADDDRQSYSLSEQENQYVRDHGLLCRDGMTYIATDLRLEHTDYVYSALVSLAGNNNKNEIIEVFSHEWLNPRELFWKIEEVCQFAVHYGYEFSELSQ